MIRHRLTGLMLACSAASLAGCGVMPHSDGRSAVDHSPAPSALESTPICCQSLAGLNYQPLTGNDQDLVLHFNHQAPAFNFPDGKSFYRAFQLPQDTLQVTLAIRAPIRESGVFVPTLLLLNDHYQPVRRLQGDFLAYQGPNGFRDARLAGKVTVAPGPDAAYLVVYASASQRHRTTRYDTAEQTYRRLRGFQQIDSSIHKAPHTATGQLIVSVKTQTGNGGLLAPLSGREGTRRISDPGGKSEQLKEIVNDAGRRPPDTDQGASVNAEDRPTAPASAPEVQLTAQPAGTTSSRRIPPQEDFDYKRMINAALKAGDIELAIQLADRAEASGRHGIRKWLSQQLEVR